MEEEYDFQILNGEEEILDEDFMDICGESFEILIEDDLTEEEIRSLEKVENEATVKMSDIPNIKFVDEDDIELSIPQAQGMQNDIFKCYKCGKVYKRKNYLSKHTVVCGELTFYLFIIIH